MAFELTNNHRKYLGLELVTEKWNKVHISDTCYVYFEGDVIRKRIIASENYYYECEMKEETSQNRSVLLPKTKRGKEKKLTVATLMERKCFGNYFHFDKDKIRIANVTTQQTYYSSEMAGTNCDGINELQAWLDNWVANSSEKDLLDIEKFSKAERRHCKFKEGDFFRFRIDRETYGYGRILFNFDNLRKEKIPHWSILMGKPLIIKVYHIITKNQLIQLEELRDMPAIPSQYIMDNVFYYGEYEIVGNLPLNDSELDFPIMYGRSISHIDLNKIIFQRGLVYKEIPYSPEALISGDFRFNRIGFGLNINKRVLEECIKEKTNQPYWNQSIYINKGDLRNPANAKERDLVLRQFGEE